MTKDLGFKPRAQGPEPLTRGPTAQAHREPLEREVWTGPLDKPHGCDSFGLLPSLVRAGREAAPKSLAP